MKGESYRLEPQMWDSLTSTVGARLTADHNAWVEAKTQLQPGDDVDFYDAFAAGTYKGAYLRECLGNQPAVLALQMAVFAFRCRKFMGEPTENQPSRSYRVSHAHLSDLAALVSKVPSGHRLALRAEKAIHPGEASEYYVGFASGMGASYKVMKRTCDTPTIMLFVAAKIVRCAQLITESEVK
jgi:hypothetical protein